MPTNSDETRPGLLRLPLNTGIDTAAELRLLSSTAHQGPHNELTGNLISNISVSFYLFGGPQLR